MVTQMWIASKMWREKLCAIKEIASGLETHVQRGVDAAQLKRMVAFVDETDPLVAYAAMQHLQRIFFQQDVQHSDCYGKWINGYRFQLLRCLIATKHASSDSDGASSDDGGGGRHDGEPERLHPGLEAVLKQMTPLREMVVVAFDAAKHPIARSSVVIVDLLGFLSELTKELAKVIVEDEEDETLLDLHMLTKFHELAETLLDIFGGLEYAKQPTYVACAIVAFLHGFLRFGIAASTGSIPGACRHGRLKSEWLQRCVDTVLLRSSLLSFAMTLLGTREPPAMSSSASFISSESRYPFLQCWLSFVSSLVLALLENIDAVDLLSQPNAFDLKNTGGVDQLPDRDTILAVLSEQDDVMVEVLNTLLRITILLEANDGERQRSSSTSQYQWLMKYHIEELDPDLLFASILSTFGHDHLVLLDLLISAETVMLEYLLRYLRRLAANWESSCSVFQQSSSTPRQLEHVMAVLIRLRLEIDKQVASGIFPYNPKPLLRRLLEVEQLYDET